MFQQNGNHEVHAGANFKKHLSSMSVKELKAELDAIFEREESAGVKADPELIVEYITAIEELETDKCSQAQSYEEFEKTWSNFTKNHPDLFPPPETKPQKRSMHIGRFVEAAVLAATLLVVSVTAFNWQIISSTGAKSYWVYPLPPLVFWNWLSQIRTGTLH